MKRCLFLVIISNTPDKINIIPRVILKVKCSLKNKIPKKIAVRGSKAPRIAVVVEPISLIAIVIVSRDIIVGNMERQITHSHINGL